MAYELREMTLTPYRIDGTGPMGFAVMSSHPVLGAHQPRGAAALKAGEIARKIVWVNAQSVASAIETNLSGVLPHLRVRGGRNEPFLLLQDRSPDAIGGYLLVGDLWHWGHVRDAQESCLGSNIYMPLEWAAALIENWAHQEPVPSE